MKESKRSYSNKNLRHIITNEAARLIYEEGIKQYHTAKWRAAKNVLARGGIKQSTMRAHELPSNGEISDQLYRLAAMYEGETLIERLFDMRLLALDVMEALEEFTPRLIGSVSTGKIKKTSDIDLHIFTDNIEMLEARLDQLEWAYEKEEVTIRYLNRYKDFTHIYLDKKFSVELSVYPMNDIRVRGRSSTDGKPIDRLSYRRLLDLIQEEHSEEWSQTIDYNCP